MIRQLALLGALCLAAVPGAATAQVMWQNVERGMTPDEVFRAQPQAEPNPDPGTLFDGSRCNLHIAQYPAGDYSYEVCFFFKDMALTQVTLGMAGEPEKLDFDSVVAVLTERYGAPASVAKDATGWNADWMLSSGVNIAVVYIEAPLVPLININYQYRIKSEASKL